MLASSRDLLLTKSDSEINVFKSSDVAIMDLASTGSNISKYKIDEAAVVAIKEKVVTPVEKSVSEEKKEEPKKMSMADFIDDFKI